MPTAPIPDLQNTEHTIPENDADTAAQKKQDQINASYYFRIAKHFRYLMVALIGVLAVFLVVMFSTYRNEITIENMKYFLRYIDTRQAEKSATTNTIVYNETESIVRLGVYKNGLVVVGYDRVQIYDLTGEAILNIAQSNASPQLAVSDASLLIYNIGGTTFQVYNSLSKEFEASLEYPISCAAVGNSGTFLIATRAMEYRSVVYVYNKNFEQIYRWYTPDKLVMDADFRDGDKEFMIAALGTTTEGVCYTEIILCETDKEEKKAQFRIEDEIIYRVRYTSDGGYILIGGKAIYYYNAQGERINTVSYSGYTPTTVDTNGTLSYFSVNKNIVGSNYEVTVTDQTGKVLYVGTVYGEITKALLHENALYLLFDRSVLRISLETGNQIEKEISANCITIQALDKNTLMLCYANETRIIDIDQFFFGEESKEATE
ncbi:MAG: hypothetical protein J6I50_11890 [Clostridia bacterium]|nr:hypothetical protein [Clostridia bacterium]